MQAYQMITKNSYSDIYAEELLVPRMVYEVRIVLCPLVVVFKVPCIPKPRSFEEITDNKITYTNFVVLKILDLRPWTRCDWCGYSNRL
jgi:hypothetical protein